MGFGVHVYEGGTVEGPTSGAICPLDGVQGLERGGVQCGCAVPSTCWVGGFIGVHCKDGVVIFGDFCEDL